MTSSFKIPKRKQTPGSDSAHLHMQSPLSRLQSPAPECKSYGLRSSPGSTERVHAGSSLRPPMSRQSTACKPLLRNPVFQTLLGLNDSRRAATANHRTARGWNHQSQAGQEAVSSPVCLSKGWRPKRASDRLLQLDSTSERQSPPHKKKSESSGVSLPNQSISVDSLAELRAAEHAGSLSSSSPTWMRATQESDRGSNSSMSDPEDALVSPSRNKMSSGKSPSDVHRPSASLVRSPLFPGQRDRRQRLNRLSWLGANSNQTDELREKDRETRRAIGERKTISRSAILYLRRNNQNQKQNQMQLEPIVLSSEEDEGDERTDKFRSQNPAQTQVRQVCPSRPEPDVDSPPSFLELEFSSLHAGLMHADANGKMMILENGVIVPLKGEEEGEITVVASQVRGYGVWDGGVARDGALLAKSEGPAPSFLFLWVTDAQANLLQRDLTAIQTTAAASGPPCSFVLLVLQEQLQELQAALLASLLDMEEFRKGRSSSGGATSPLDWTDGLLLLHSCPPPLDQHLLRLLGHSAETSSPLRRSVRNQNSKSSPPQLPSRLIQYPAPPCKGRITVTKEDLACLDGGEFLNDVIIDFYLKFLLLEGVGGAVAERSHVFSSFFFKQLSRRRVAGEDAAASVPDRHMRHQRVRTWTRHVDIFTKDFLFVPVNQEAHWYLVVVCFPGLEDVKYEERAREETSFSARSPPPAATQLGCRKDAVMKRPCVLVMDSLKMSDHDNVCRLLRDYLQVEWQVRRGQCRLFTSDNMRSCSCSVPKQDNSSDCGLYLLQYVETFLQNPVVHFDLPLRLDNWFPRQRVRQKREEIRRLIMRLHESQQQY